MCARLNKSLCGTRDAPQDWEWTCTQFMESIGFTPGLGSTCVFYHGERDIRCIIHGDDFTILGSEEQLNWFREHMQGKFLMKVKARLGPNTADDKEVRILNRVITWTDQGILYEADQRHTDLILKDLGLQPGSKGLSTPGERIKVGEPGDEEELGDKEATMHRAITANALYLSQDRADIQYAVKELSRRMSKPDRADWDNLKRLGRYLVGRPRIVTLFGYQEANNKVMACVDTDYAGCKRTRKSTSGRVIKLGQHVIKTWSLTQGIFTLSSGEAEYYGLVKGTAIALGARTILQDYGVKVQVQLYSDVQAALGLQCAVASAKLDTLKYINYGFKMVLVGAISKSIG